MLSRDEVNKYGPPSFHLAQKEKDYMQHYILSFLSRSGFRGVFKGGTALQKAYGLARFSEDLDFTLNGAVEPDRTAMSAFLSSAGFSNPVWKEEETDVSSNAKLRYRGPLYNGTPISEGVVLLQFSKREKTLLAPNTVMVTPPYPDLMPYQLLVMDKQEIAAEKIRTILTRSSARDLYDLYFLLHQKTRLRIDLVDKKLMYYGKKFSFGEFGVRIKKLEGIWNNEITALTPAQLNYDVVARLVVAATGKAMKT
jgi:predicted nucleotidyltransferase component of viral defense system